MNEFDPVLKIESLPSFTPFLSKNPSNICIFAKFFVPLQPQRFNDMSKSLKDRLDYLIALVSEFAAAHHLSLQQAYLYLQRYKGLDFADEFYDVEHTLSFDQAVEDVTMYCQRMGGAIA
jgi:hypothetical protein